MLQQPAVLSCGLTAVRNRVYIDVRFDNSMRVMRLPGFIYAVWFASVGKTKMFFRKAF